MQTAEVNVLNSASMSPVFKAGVTNKNQKGDLTISLQRDIWESRPVCQVKKGLQGECDQMLKGNEAEEMLQLNSLGAVH